MPKKQVELFYEDLKDLLELTPKKDVLFIIGEWNAKVGSQETSGVIGKLGLECRRPGFNPWIGKIPWRRKWQPTPLLLPGESHGQRSLAGYTSIVLQRVAHEWNNFVDKGPSSQRYGFSSSHVWMWELDHKESWVPQNWCFWTVVLWRLFRIPCTARRPNQSILKEINPEYSLEGLMLKPKLQYFGHLIWRTD